MNQLLNNLSKYQPYALTILRLVVAFLFIQHATSKLFFVPFVDGVSGVPLFSLFGLAAIIELVGGGLLILGLFVRPVAFILAGQMAVAYIGFHVLQWSSASTLFTPLLNGGESAVLFCFAFLYLTFSGAGALALDQKN